MSAEANDVAIIRSLIVTLFRTAELEGNGHLKATQPSIKTDSDRINTHWLVLNYTLSSLLA